MQFNETKRAHTEGRHESWRCNKASEIDGLSEKQASEIEKSDKGAEEVNAVNKRRYKPEFLEKT